MSQARSAANKGGIRGTYASASIQARRGWRKASSGSRIRLVSDSSHRHDPSRTQRSTSASHHIVLDEADPAAPEPFHDEGDDLVDIGGPSRVQSTTGQHQANPSSSSSQPLLRSQRTSPPPLTDDGLLTPRQVAKSRATDSGPPLQSTPLSSNRRTAAPTGRSRLSLFAKDADVSVSRDRSFHLPTLQARCQALTTNAQAVLNFYADLAEQFDATDGAIAIDDQLTSEMRRSWEPFESYKTNQLLERSQFHHHFIFIEEHADLLLPHGSLTIPAGLEEATRLANLATFAHYIWNIPPEASDGQLSDDWAIRSLSEMQDAWRVFWRIIIPSDMPMTDELLALYLDLSTQTFCARLALLTERVEKGDITPETAEAEAFADLEDMLGPSGIQEGIAMRQLDNQEAQDILRSWSQMSRLRRADINQMRFDAQTCRESYKLSELAAKVTNLVVTLGQEVEGALSESLTPHLLQDLFPNPVPPVGVAGGRDTTRERPRPQEAAKRWLGRSSVPSKPLSYGGDDASVEESQSGSSQNPGWLKDLVAGRKVSRAASPPSERSEATQQSQISMSNSQVMRLLTVEEREAALAEILSESRISTQDIDEEDGSEVIPSADQEVEELSAYFIPSDEEEEEGDAEDDLSADFSIRGGQIIHKSSRLSRSSMLSNRSSDEEMDDDQLAHSLQVSAQSPVKQLQIRGGRLQRAQAEQQAISLRPTGKGVRVTRFDSQSVSEVSQETRPISGIRTKNFYGQRKSVTILDPTPRSPRKARRHHEQPSPRTRSSWQHKLGRPGMMPFVGISLEQPSAEVRRAFHSHRKPRTVPSPQSPPRRLTRAAARLQEEAKAMADMEDSMDRMSVNQQDERDRDAQVTEMVMDDDFPAMPPPNNQAQERELLPLQAVEADANHFDNLGAFEGDNDRDIREARKQLTLEYWFARVRPGFEHFPQPTPVSAISLPPSQQRSTHRDAVLIPDSQASVAVEVPANQFQHEDAVNPGTESEEEHSEDLSSRDEEHGTVPEPQGVRRSQRLRQSGRFMPSQPRVSVSDSPQSSEDELEEMLSEVESIRSLTPRQSDVPPSVLEETPGAPRGVGKRLRKPWTTQETTCLLDAMYKLARHRRSKPTYHVYAEILSRHGKYGSDDQVLKERNNAELKAKAKAELLRMAREGERIPYWKRLYWDGLFETREGKAALRAATTARKRGGGGGEGTLSAPQDVSQAEDAVDSAENDEELQDALMRDVYEQEGERGGDDDNGFILADTDDEASGVQASGEEEQGGDDDRDAAVNARSSPQTSVDELELEPDLRTQTPRPRTPPPPRNTATSDHRPTPPASALRSPGQRRRASRAESHVHFEDSEMEEDEDEENERDHAQVVKQEEGSSGRKFLSRSFSLSPSPSPSLRARISATSNQVIKRGRYLLRPYSRPSEPPTAKGILEVGHASSSGSGLGSGETSPRKRPRARPFARGRQSAPAVIVSEDLPHPPPPPPLLTDLAGSSSASVLPIQADRVTYDEGSDDSGSSSSLSDPPDLEEEQEEEEEEEEAEERAEVERATSEPPLLPPPSSSSSSIDFHAGGGGGGVVQTQIGMNPRRRGRRQSARIASLSLLRGNTATSGEESSSAMGSSRGGLKGRGRGRGRARGRQTTGGLRGRG